MNAMNHTQLTDFEVAVHACRDCKVYEARYHDQYCRALGLPVDSELTVYPLRSGITMRLAPNLPEIPTWWDYLLCPTHEKEF
jgi:hypothetical protein